MYFDPVKAYGFIKPYRVEQHPEVQEGHGKRTKNDIFFHYVDFHSPVTPYLGLEVTYEYVLTKRGTRATNVVVQ